MEHWAVYILGGSRRRCEVRDQGAVDHGFEVFFLDLSTGIVATICAGAAVTALQVITQRNSATIADYAATIECVRSWAHTKLQEQTSIDAATAKASSVAVLPSVGSGPSLPCSSKCPPMTPPTTAVQIPPVARMVTAPTFGPRQPSGPPPQHLSLTAPQGIIIPPRGDIPPPEAPPAKRPRERAGTAVRARQIQAIMSRASNPKEILAACTDMLRKHRN